MPEQGLSFIGSWEKIESGTCGQIYPAAIHFEEDGSYFAENDPSSPMIIWDSGSYEVVEPDQVRISLANDARLPYTFSIDDSILTLVDREGCEFAYRRMI